LLTSILSLMDCVTRFPTQRFDWQGMWGPSRKAEPGETIFFADGKASPQLWAILDPQHQDFKKFGRIMAAHEAGHWLDLYLHGGAQCVAQDPRLGQWRELVAKSLTVTWLHEAIATGEYRVMRQGRVLKTRLSRSNIDCCRFLA